MIDMARAVSVKVMIPSCIRLQCTVTFAVLPFIKILTTCRGGVCCQYSTVTEVTRGFNFCSETFYSRLLSWWAALLRQSTSKVNLDILSDAVHATLAKLAQSTARAKCNARSTRIDFEALIKGKELQNPGTNFMDKTLKHPESTDETTLLVLSNIWYKIHTMAWSLFPSIKASKTMNLQQTAGSDTAS